jgi:preprotein translocase subunit SecB|tara:strand:- start:1718 stop:2161 length:444 start_codon:yes stop_codon:yes gene_type:complete
VNTNTPGERENPQFGIRTQYVKQLNFENLHVPGESISDSDPSDTDVKIDIEVNSLGEDSFEISLRIIANSRLDDSLLYHFDLTYAAVFYISGIPKESMQALLLIECPKMIFPFARQIIFETTRESGHAPLMLSPIDFLAHFLERQKT